MGPKIGSAKILWAWAYQCKWFTIQHRPSPNPDACQGKSCQEGTWADLKRVNICWLNFCINTSGKGILFQLCNLWVMPVRLHSQQFQCPHSVLWYCNTLCLLEPCKVLGFRGCNLWVLPLAWRARPAAKLGPCIVDDPTGHTCKLQSASIPHPGSRLRSRLREVLVPRSRRAFSTQQQV